METVWEISQLLCVVATLVVTVPIKVTVFRTAVKLEVDMKEKQLFPI